MEVIEPASSQRQKQLLPGSPERENIKVESLEKLKQELDKANQKASRRTKVINKGIIVASVLTVLLLILGKRDSGSAAGSAKFLGKKTKPTNSYSWRKALKVIGYALSILGFIKGTLGMSQELEVIEPDGSRAGEKTYSHLEELSPKDKLRVLSVRATLDVLKEHGLADPKTIKHRSSVLNFRAPKGANKILIKETKEYGRTI